MSDCQGKQLASTIVQCNRVGCEQKRMYHGNAGMVERGVAVVGYVNKIATKTEMCCDRACSLDVIQVLPEQMGCRVESSCACGVIV